MKNIKKILIALALIAVLVSSLVIVVATASDSDPLESYKTFLNDAKTGETLASRNNAIRKLYNYLDKNPIDPATVGYDEFMQDFYGTSLSVANDYYKIVASKETPAEKMVALSTVYNYLAECAIDPSASFGEGDEAVTYASLNASIAVTNFEIVQGLYAEALKSAKGDDTVDPPILPDYVSAAGTLKNVFTQLTNHPVDPETEGYAAFEKQINELSLQISVAMYDEIVAAKTPANPGDPIPDTYRGVLVAKLPVLVAHMDACPVDIVTYAELAEDYNALVLNIDKLELERIEFFYADYEAIDPASCPNPESTKITLHTRAYNALLNAVIDESTPGYSEFKTKVENEKAVLDEAKEARRVALDDAANLAEYEFTEGLIEKLFNDPNGDSMGAPNKSSDAYSEWYDGAWRYVYKASPTHCYGTLATKYTVEGFTIEFDTMVEGTNGEHFEGASYHFRYYGKGNDNAQFSGDFSQLFQLSYDAATDTISISSSNKNTSDEAQAGLKNIACEGQWFNIIITMDPDTCRGSLYINYEYAFDIYYGPSTAAAAKDVQAAEIRCNTNFSWQNVYYDNYRYYQGKSYRILDKFDGMTNEDKFEFYVQYFLDDTRLPTGRNAGYLNAKDLLPYIESLYAGVPDAELSEQQARLKEKAEILKNFNYKEEVLEPVRLENLARIKELVAEVTKIEVISTNKNKIDIALTSLNVFLEENSDYIDKAHPEYVAAMAEITAVKDGVAKCDNAVLFARALIQFNRATSLASMQKRANAAAEIYKLARYDKEENREFVKNDPSMIELQTILNGDLAEGDEGYIYAFDYYEGFAKVIAIQAKIENSKRILDCVGFIEAIEGYEDTEAFWFANYDEVNFYITIIRDVVSVNNYDPDVAGVDEAIEKYSIIDAYFYDLLQQDHIAVISEQLARFPESGSYIEKVGICTYLDKYFADNDIDLDIEALAELKYTLEIYKAELEGQKETYSDLLEQNTQYFIDTVKKMSSALTYAEVKPLYDEALVYYYGMNVDSAEAVEAIELFNAYEITLGVIEQASGLFEAAARNLRFAKTNDQIYLVLVQCMMYADYIDLTYSEDVAEAAESYEEALESYNARAAAINAEIYAVSDVASAVRSDEIPSVVLAIVSGIYKN